MASPLAAGNYSPRNCRPYIAPRWNLAIRKTPDVKGENGGQALALSARVAL
jgi:hypothetical protein